MMSSPLQLTIPKRLYVPSWRVQWSGSVAAMCPEYHAAAYQNALKAIALVEELVLPFSRPYRHASYDQLIPRPGLGRHRRAYCICRPRHHLCALATAARAVIEMITLPYSSYAVGTNPEPKYKYN